MVEVLIGLLGGTLIGATGIGSGSLVAPLLVLAGYSPAVAVGTGLIALIFSKLTAAELHRRLGHWPGRNTAIIVAGGLTGVALTWFLSPFWLRVTGVNWETAVKFALMGSLLLIAITLQIPRNNLDHSHGLLKNCENNPIVLFTIGAVVAVVVALTSAGAGGLLIPALLLVTPWKTQELAAVSNVYGTIVGLASILVYAGSHSLNLSLIGLVLLGLIPGVFVGVRLSRLLTRQTFVRGAGVLAAYLAVALFFHK